MIVRPAGSERSQAPVAMGCLLAVALTSRHQKRYPHMSHKKSTSGIACDYDGLGTSANLIPWTGLFLKLPEPKCPEDETFFLPSCQRVECCQPTRSAILLATRAALLLSLRSLGYPGKTTPCICRSGWECLDHPGSMLTGIGGSSLITVSSKGQILFYTRPLHPLLDMHSTAE